MKQLLLQGVPNRRLLPKPRKFKKTLADKRFVWEALSYAAWVVAFYDITIDNFEKQPEETQAFLFDAYKLWMTFKRWDICEPPIRWRQMVDLFER